MPLLFWVCRDEEEERWLVIVEGQTYGEYVNEEMAVLDAIDLANDARATGNTAEVWHRAMRRAYTDNLTRWSLARPAHHYEQSPNRDQDRGHHQDY